MILYTPPRRNVEEIMQKSHDHSVAEQFKDPLNLESSKSPAEPTPTPQLVDVSVNPLWMITAGAAAFLLLVFALS